MTDHPTPPARGDALEFVERLARRLLLYVGTVHDPTPYTLAAGLYESAVLMRREADALSAAPAQQAGDPTPAEAAAILGRVLEGMSDEAVIRVEDADWEATKALSDRYTDMMETAPKHVRCRAGYAAVLSAIAAEAGRDHAESNP